MTKFKEFLTEALAIADVNIEKGSKEVAVMQGRFQPPHKIHIKMITDAYKKTKNEVAVFIIKSNSDKSPFDAKLVEKILKKAIKIPFKVYIINNGFIGEMINILRNEDKEPTTFWIGTDRKKSYEGQIKRYKEKLNLDIIIKEIKRSDEDVSASKIRDALVNDDEKTFKELMDKSSYGFYNELKKVLQK